MRGIALLAAGAAAVVLAGEAAAEPRLVGTVLAPAVSGAVFEDGSGRQALRRVGDVVGEGLTLVAVRRGAVEVRDAAGRTRTLRAGAALRPPAAPGGAEPAEGGAEAPHDTGAPAAGRDPEEAAVHPVHVRHGSRLAHARAGGRFEGLRLVGGPPDTPLVRAGLRPGDLIVAVGGRDLDGGDAGLVPALLEALDEADAARPLLVEARRGDEVLRVAVGGDAGVGSLTPTPTAAYQDD